MWNTKGWMSGESLDRDLFPLLIDSLPYPVQVFSRDGTMVAANPAFLAEFQIPDKDMVIGRYNILKDPTIARNGLSETIRRAFAGEVVCVPELKIPVQSIKHEHRIPSREQATVYQDITTVPLKDAAGNLLCVVNIQITRRKYTERMEILQAKDYIDKHWLEPFRTEDVAKAVHLSPAHFARLFKEHVGMTPHDYHLTRKIEGLKVSLLDSNLTIEEAFAACGLPYHGHYAALFRKQTGLSPSEYRKGACG